MTSSDIDAGSLQAVKNLRSKFEQLASGTSTTSTDGQRFAVAKPSSSSPKRSVSNSQLNDGSVSDAGHIRTSSSSSEFHSLVKRAPPPPPSRSPKAKGPPPSPSASPAPRSVSIPPSRPETKEEDVLPSVSALRSRFTSPQPPISASIQRRNIELGTDYPPPAIPPRPTPVLIIQRSESLSDDGMKAMISKRSPPPPVPVRRPIFGGDEGFSGPSTSGSSSEETEDFQESRPISPVPPPIPARRLVIHDRPYSISSDKNLNDSDSSLSLPRRSPRTGNAVQPPLPRLSVSPKPQISDARKAVPPPPIPARPQSLLIAEPSLLSPLLSQPNGNGWIGSDRKPLGSGKLPPPPMRTIGPGDKLPPPRRPSSPSSEEESGEDDDHKSQGVDMMPDSSLSSRCPPLLRFRNTYSEPRIHVHPHSGCVAVSGSRVAVGHHHHIKIYDLAQSDAPVLSLGTKEMGIKDAKVTCMEFRPTLKVDDRGFLLWIGTKDGTVCEVDVRTGAIRGTKYAAHIYPIAHIFRHGNSMITLDESGKTLVFSPTDDRNDIVLVASPPRVVRTTEKQDFAKMIDGKLWTAARMEQQGSPMHRLPIIRVFDIFSPGSTGKSVMPTDHVGPVTSAAILPSQPGMVYVGHEEGYISLWLLDTDDGYPQCIEVTRVSMSDVLCLEGVNDRLWAGGRNGMISAYDVSQRPWLVTNSWNAHPGLPVLKLITNHYGIELTGQLCVASVGRDENVRLWDGLLGLDWVDKELVKIEPSISTFREVCILVVSWNCDSARPDSLSGDPRNANFLHEILQSVDQPPDVIVFGFQEVVDLENRKMAAKNVILGGNSKKKPEDALSDKVTGAYKRWYEYLNLAVKSGMPPDVSYTAIHTESLVGLFSCIFVKSELRNQFNDVLGNLIKRGMGGRYGNKGAIVARFVIGDSSICFVNCHLAAGQNAIRRRNADIAGILEEKAVFAPTEHQFAYVGGGDGSMVLDHEFVILNGDLNYRLDHRRDALAAFIRAGDISSLLSHDQLLREMKFNRACRLRFFTEGPLTFAPTYKYDRNSDEYDTSEKRRPPAWCDRILWRSRATSRVRQLHYRRYEVNVSDHRPISAAFAVTIKQFDRDAREKAKVALQARWIDEQKRLLVACHRFYLAQALL